MVGTGQVVQHQGKEQHQDTHGHRPQGREQLGQPRLAERLVIITGKPIENQPKQRDQHLSLKEKSMRQISPERIESLIYRYLVITYPAEQQPRHDRRYTIGNYIFTGLRTLPHSLSNYSYEPSRPQFDDMGRFRRGFVLLTISHDIIHPFLYGLRNLPEIGGRRLATDIGGS